jgi:hypothetical protein
MNIQPFIKLQKEFEVINKSLLVNNPNNFDNEYTSLADAIEPHLNAEELGDLHELLCRLEQLTEKAIEQIQEKSKKYLKLK